ncbi:MAG: tetratricopeptide repeat protein [Phycisphaerae bacterium]|nr:tetratricopeptide repeat protein [Phycisphaerae bacterium]
MNTGKIIISIYFLAVCSNLTFAAMAMDEEFNPVDVIDDYFTGGKTASAQQKLSPRLAEAQISLSPAMRLPKEIVELFIPANLAGSSTQAKPPADELHRKLWETTIALANENDENNKAELLQMIEKIKSLKFAKLQANQPTDSAEKTRTMKTETAKRPVVLLKPEKIQAAPAVEKTIDGNENLTDDALAKIENNPDDIQNPYELAEILARGGHLTQAAICYKQTLKAGLFENQPETKVWILFQLANCLKENQPAEAIKIYARLLTEYPDSTWAKAAKRYNELLNLQLQNKPYELIKEQIKDLQEKKPDEQF